LGNTVVMNLKILSRHLIQRERKPRKEALLQRIMSSLGGKNGLLLE
jgi:hypothetical protein